MPRGSPDRSPIVASVKSVPGHPRESSCDEDAIGHRVGSGSAMDEARDHGLVLMAPVLAPRETGEVAVGTIRADLAIGPGDRARFTAEGRLARRAAAPACRWSAPRRDRRRPSRPALTAASPVAAGRHRDDLVLHGPGRRLLDPETAAEFYRRDAALCRHDQVGGCEPKCQRQLGRMEDRACLGRCLCLAPLALKEPTGPPARNAPDGRRRGRRNHPAGAAGPGPSGTGPRRRRPRETLRHEPSTRNATLEFIAVTSSGGASRMSRNQFAVDTGRIGCFIGRCGIVRKTLGKSTMRQGR